MSAIWGLTFPAIRGALSDIDPVRFVFLRFLIAGAVFCPVVLARRELRADLARILLPGMLLGVLAWISYFTQTLGLTTVEAGRAAFITGLNVLLVPFLAPLFRAGRPDKSDWAAASVATAGLFFLTEPARIGFGRGETYVLACAFSYALYLIVLSKILTRWNPTGASLALAQILGVVAASGCVFSFSPPAPVSFSPGLWAALLYCSVFATAVVFWLQARYQRFTTPQATALIFATEPIFAAIFALFLLGERLSPMGILGAALIVGAVAGKEVLPRASRF